MTTSVFIEFYYDWLTQQQLTKTYFTRSLGILIYSGSHGVMDAFNHYTC